MRKQPPLRGCVLKLNYTSTWNWWGGQPPLRGCVLKLHNDNFF